ncbi:MAG: hypothetical protein JWO77_1440 [Ilumatobacteraceae bacterium]|nr:hypothetical protein [Ilumatobacteraceae bacterium]
MLNDKPARKAYSVAEVAMQIGLSRSTLYTEMAAGRLSYVKVGARRLITGAAVDAYLRGLDHHAEAS